MTKKSGDRKGTGAELLMMTDVGSQAPADLRADRRQDGWAC